MSEAGESDASDPGLPGGDAVPSPPPAGPTGPPPEVLPPPLAPMREPKPFSMHWAVDAAVCFLVLVVVLWIFLGVPVLVVVAISLLVGLAAAPWTRDVERKGLAERSRRHQDSGANPGEPPAVPPA